MHSFSNVLPTNINTMNEIKWTKTWSMRTTTNLLQSPWHATQINFTTSIRQWHGEHHRMFQNADLRLMLASTRLKWAIRPPYGRPGVPSTIYSAYSGCQAVRCSLKNKNVPKIDLKQIHQCSSIFNYIIENIYPHEVLEIKLPYTATLFSHVFYTYKTWHSDLSLALISPSLYTLWPKFSFIHTLVVTVSLAHTHFPVSLSHTVHM